MHLEEVKTENFSLISDDIIIKKGIRKIHYILSGRNAWHTTWVNQYSSGCMHENFFSASMRAEELRNQGSVFYILEIPALVVEGKRQTLVVTQINTDDVLRSYTPTPARPIEALYPKINYLHPGASMVSFYKTVVSNHDFWHNPPPLKNSVIILTTKKKLKDFEKYDKSKLIESHSSSIGTDCYLRWTIKEGIDRSYSLQKLMKIRLKKIIPEKAFLHKFGYI